MKWFLRLFRRYKKLELRLDQPNTINGFGEPSVAIPPGKWRIEIVTDKEEKS